MDPTFSTARFDQSFSLKTVSRWGDNTVGVEEMEAAISYFKGARQLKKANPEMYNELFNSLIDEGLIEKAADLIYEDNINITTSPYNDADLIELDQFSYGVAIVLFEQYIDANPWLTKFSMRLRDGHERFKEYVYNNFVNWECNTDPDNKNILTINKKLTQKELDCTDLVNKIFSRTQELTKQQSLTALNPPKQTPVKKIKEFYRALDFINRNIGTGRPNAHIVNELMTKKLPTQNFEPKKYLFFKAKENKSIDIKTYEFLMGAAASVKNFPAIKWAFEEAKEDKQVRPETYETFIAAAQKLGKLVELKEKLTEAEKAGFATTAVYNAAIIGLGEEDLLKAEEIFERLKVEEKDDGNTYAAMLKVMKKQNQLPALNTILDESIKANKCNESVVTAFIEVTSGSGKFVEAEKLFWGKEKTINVCRAFMKALIETGKHSEVRKIFDFMRSNKMGTPPWANSFLVESLYKEGNSNVFNFFEHLSPKNLSRTDAKMYNLLIKEVAKQKDPIRKLNKYFMIGHNQSLIDSSTYISMINVAIDIQDKEEIMHFFTLSKYNNMDTKRVYNVCVDGLFKLKEFDQARKIYSQAGFSVDERCRKGVNIIDLRGLSHGAGLIALDKHINKAPSKMFCVLSENNKAKYSSPYYPYEKGDYKDNISRHSAARRWTCQADPSDKNLLIMTPMK